MFENLSKPPRVCVSGVFMKSVLGNMMTIVGFCILAFSSIFFWVFTMRSTLLSSYQFMGALETAPGIVEGYEETNFEVNNSTVVKTYYSFKYQGREGQDFSYCSGCYLEKGTKVVIEFPAGDPQISRIQGMRRKTVPMIAGAFPLVFLFAGFICLIFGLKSGFKMHSLLKHGLLAEGQVKGLSKTGVRINHQYQYKVSLEYTAQNGRTIQAQQKTLMPDNYPEGETIALLYLPYYPETVMFEGEIENAFKVQNGQIVTDGFLFGLVPIGLFLFVNFIGFFIFF